MNIEEKLEGKVLTLLLRGRLDTATFTELDAAVAKYIDSVDRINFDLKNVEYISSAGIRVILAVHKKMSAKDGLYIYNADENLREIFDITGFLGVLNLV